jgi:hypothetical protein
MVQMFGTGKAYQQEPLCLRERETYAPGYKSHKDNTFCSCVTEMHLQIIKSNL